MELTEHAGPAARITPRHRSMPENDWQVPDALKRLPFLPSIESAYDQGCRRMVIEPYYTKLKILLEYGEEVVFIGGRHARDVAETFMSVHGRSQRKEAELLELVISLLAAAEIPGAKAKVAVADLFIQAERTP